MDQEIPQYVYRLANQDEWIAAQENGFVPLRDIDKKDGYIHLSTKEQLLETAALHFAGIKNLLALEIPSKTIAEKLKFELSVKRGALFPHLYGRLATNDVVQVIKLFPDGDKFRWEEAP